MSIRYEQKIAGSMRSNYDFIRETHKGLALNELALGREALESDVANMEAVYAIGRKAEIEGIRTNERIQLKYIDLLKYKSEERRKQALTNTLMSVAFGGLQALGDSNLPSLFGGGEGMGSTYLWDGKNSGYGQTNYSTGSAATTFKGVNSGLGVF